MEILFSVMAGLICGFAFGVINSLLKKRDRYNDEPTVKECFEQIEDAVEDLEGHGWETEVSGNKEGTFVYYKFIAPAKDVNGSNN